MHAGELIHTHAHTIYALHLRYKYGVERMIHDILDTRDAIECANKRMCVCVCTLLFWFSL